MIRMQSGTISSLWRFSRPISTISFSAMRSRLRNGKVGSTVGVNDQGSIVTRADNNERSLVNLLLQLSRFVRTTWMRTTSLIDLVEYLILSVEKWRKRYIYTYVYFDRKKRSMMIRSTHHPRRWNRNSIRPAPPVWIVRRAGRSPPWRARTCSTSSWTWKIAGPGTLGRGSDPGSDPGRLAWLTGCTTFWEHVREKENYFRYDRKISRRSSSRSTRSDFLPSKLPANCRRLLINKVSESLSSHVFQIDVEKYAVRLRLELD